MGNAKQWLREAGIEAVEISGSRAMRVPHTALLLAPPGHWAHDPRSLYEPDPEMVADMIERFTQREPNANSKPIYVWAETVNAKGDEGPGAGFLLVGDGSQRTNAVRAAAAELRRRKLLGANGHLMVQVEFHLSSDRAAFLGERLSRNDHTRLSRPDTASILAFRTAQLLALGWSHAQIAGRCGHGITTSVVEALETWDARIATSVRRRIDAGEIPIALLPEIQRHPKAVQDTVATTLIAAGVTTQKGATQRRNKAKDASDPWARRMSPRAMRDVSKAVTSANSKGDRYLEGVADALTLATLTGNDAAKHLDNMPRKVADLIRAARAPKGGAK